MIFTRQPWILHSGIAQKASTKCFAYFFFYWAESFDFHFVSKFLSNFSTWRHHIKHDEIQQNQILHNSGPKMLLVQIKRQVWMLQSLRSRLQPYVAEDQLGCLRNSSISIYFLERHLFCDRHNSCATAEKKSQFIWVPGSNQDHKSRGLSPNPYPDFFKVVRIYGSQIYHLSP